MTKSWRRRLISRSAGLILILFLSSCVPAPSPDVNAAALEEYVRFLADDRLAGRMTGTPGIARAEEYIAGRFHEAGLVPPPGRTDYFLPFTLYTYGFNTAACRLTLLKGDQVLRCVLDDDFAPLVMSGTGTVLGEIVYAGYGITAPEYGWNDYAGLDVKGKIVLVFRHEPERFAAWVTDPTQRFTRHALYTAKTANAARHGARAILFVTDPAYSRRDEDVSRTFTRLHPDPDAPDSVIYSNDPDFTPGAIPALQVSPFLGNWLLYASGFSPASLQKALDAGTEPKERPLQGLRTLLSVRRSQPPRPVAARNMAAFLPGTDPALQDQWIVLGAHHDHLGSFRGPGDTIYNGADDNASGTAGVLELARVLARRPGGLRHGLLFLTFSAEEAGLLGSAALFDHHLLPPKNMQVMCNLDMIGRNPATILKVGLRQDDGSWLSSARSFFSSQPLPIRFFDARDDQSLSDDYEFAYRGIPSFFFFSGLHKDYHGVDDEADRIDYRTLETRVRLVRDFILFLDGS